MSPGIAKYPCGGGCGQIIPTKSHNFRVTGLWTEPILRGQGLYSGSNSLLSTWVLCRQFIPFLQGKTLCSSSSLCFPHRATARLGIYRSSVNSSLAFYYILDSPCWEALSGSTGQQAGTSLKSPLGGVWAMVFPAVSANLLSSAFCISESVKISSANFHHILFMFWVDSFIIILLGALPYEWTLFHFRF